MSMLAAVQKAAVARWKADDGLAALIAGRVFDGMAPEGTPYPLIRVGQKTEVPALQSLGAAGWSSTLTAHAFSRALEDSEVLSVVTAMHAALADHLILEGFGAALLKPESTVTLVEENGKMRHANVRYRITAHPT
jgi:hypothetical protein